MGGYGSGRPGRRVDIEALRRLDIRALRRRGAVKPGSAGVWSWSQDGESTGSVSYRILDGVVEMNYLVTDDDGERVPIRITVLVRSLPCRFGGKRTYFLCPYCCRRCELIVMTTSGRTWGCRKCLPLRYRSQSLAPAERIQRRADALYARAGIEDGGGLVHKHKWMRWRTFNRLMESADDHSGTADAAYASRIIRLFGKVPQEL